MGDHLQVDPKVLQQAAAGINGVIKELQDVGMSEEGLAGRGFDSLKLSGLKIGTEGLKSAFDGFCDRWEWGVRALMQDANTIADKLNLDAGAYHMEDEYFIGALKSSAAQLSGDPKLTGDKAKNMSWSQMMQQYSNDQRPDYSLGSFQRAGSTAWTNWGKAFHEMGPAGTVADAAHDATGN